MLDYYFVTPGICIELNKIQRERKERKKKKKKEKKGSPDEIKRNAGLKIFEGQIMKQGVEACPRIVFSYRSCVRLSCGRLFFSAFSTTDCFRETRPATSSRLTLFATLNSFDVCQPLRRIRSRVKLIKTKGTMKHAADGIYAGQSAQDYTCMPCVCHYFGYLGENVTE